ncbi:hypothetical protein D3C72_723910 [compost metagenome]
MQAELLLARLEAGRGGHAQAVDEGGERGGGPSEHLGAALAGERQGLAQHLDPGPVRGGLRGRAADEHRRAGQPPAEGRLFEQAALADAGLTGDGDHAVAALGRGRAPGACEGRKGIVAAHERPVAQRQGHGLVGLDGQQGDDVVDGLTAVGEQPVHEGVLVGGHVRGGLAGQGLAGVGQAPGEQVEEQRAEGRHVVREAGADAQPQAMAEGGGEALAEPDVRRVERAVGEAAAVQGPQGLAQAQKDARHLVRGQRQHVEDPPPPPGRFGHEQAAVAQVARVEDFVEVGVAQPGQGARAQLQHPVLAGLIGA